jgi:cytochrome c oxidase assembly protein subunit 11
MLSRELFRRFCTAAERSYAQSVQPRARFFQRFQSAHLKNTPNPKSRNSFFRRYTTEGPNNPKSTKRAEQISKKNRDLAMYSAAALLGFVGISYAAVPLYQMFCQITGYGGTVQVGTKKEPRMVPKKEITVRFNANVIDRLPWSFVPSQNEVEVVPGETVLAFYKAENKSETPIIGVATYNVTPMKAGAYFNKVQCFCFEEQRLEPHEVVDMPVFFFLDPEMLNDPQMRDVDELTLSYTFFPSNDQNLYLEDQSQVQN